MYFHSKSIEYWSDVLQINYHTKSIMDMPLWTNKNNFDTFFSGYSNELFPSDYKESKRNMYIRKDIDVYGYCQKY